jgi:hypothetical protein
MWNRNTAKYKGNYGRLTRIVDLNVCYVFSSSEQFSTYRKQHIYLQVLFFHYLRCAKLPG